MLLSHTQNTSFSRSNPLLQIFWDQTSLGALKLCPQYYKYTIIDGYEPRETNVHFIFGGEYHHGTEYYDHLRSQNLSHNDAVHETIKNTLIRTFDKKTKTPWISNNPHKNRKTLIRSLVWYFETYKDEPTLENILLPNGKPAVEVLFSFELGCKSRITNEPFSLCGRIDKIVQFGPHRVIQDKKTTKSKLDQAFFAHWSYPENQVSAYLLAGSVTLEQYLFEMMIDAAQVLQTITRFQRGFIYRTQDQLQEWLNDTWILLHENETYVEKNQWRKNEKACGVPRVDPKTGEVQWGCPFRTVCGASPEMKPIILESTFTRRQWDPIKPKELTIEINQEIENV